MRKIKPWLIPDSDVLASKRQITLIYTPVYTSGVSPSRQRGCFNKLHAVKIHPFYNPNLINSPSCKKKTRYCGIHHLIIWFTYFVFFHEPIKAKANVDAVCENSISHHAILTESHKAAATFLTFNAASLDLLYISSHSSVIKTSSPCFMKLTSGLYAHKSRLLHPVVLVFSSQQPWENSWATVRRSVTAVYSGNTMALSVRASLPALNPKCTCPNYSFIFN